MYKPEWYSSYAIGPFRLRSWTGSGSTQASANKRADRAMARQIGPLGERLGGYEEYLARHGDEKVCLLLIASLERSFRQPGAASPAALKAIDLIRERTRKDMIDNQWAWSPLTDAIACTWEETAGASREGIVRGMENWLDLSLWKKGESWIKNQEQLPLPLIDAYLGTGEWECLMAAEGKLSVPACEKLVREYKRGRLMAIMRNPQKGEEVEKWIWEHLSDLLRAMSPQHIGLFIEGAEELERQGRAVPPITSKGWMEQVNWMTATARNLPVLEELAIVGSMAENTQLKKMIRAQGSFKGRAHLLRNLTGEEWWGLLAKLVKTASTDTEFELLTDAIKHTIPGEWVRDRKQCAGVLVHPHKEVRQAMLALLAKNSPSK